MFELSDDMLRIKWVLKPSNWLLNGKAKAVVPATHPARHFSPQRHGLSNASSRSKFVLRSWKDGTATLLGVEHCLTVGER